MRQEKSVLGGRKINSPYLNPPLTSKQKTQKLKTDKKQTQHKINLSPEGSRFFSWQNKLSIRKEVVSKCIPCKQSFATSETLQDFSAHEACVSSSHTNAIK